MSERERVNLTRVLPVLAVMWVGVTGCHSPQYCGGVACDQIPRELDKVSLPRYVIEPPDILQIDVVKSVRPPTDPLEPLDVLVIKASGTFPVDPTDDDAVKDFKRINGVYPVRNDGIVDLGPEYGSVPVKGLTLDQAKAAIESHLKKTLAAPQVSITLVAQEAKQQVTGEHLVRPDGTVSLGVFGSISLVGLTLEQAKAALEAHLAKYMVNPEVLVDVLAYNSKVYYIITDGGGYGEQVVRLPCTGTETVLDALSNINGLPAVASKKDIWIARPTPSGTEGEQILHVDWDAITRGAQTTTNYQIFPGDRLYVMADCWITADGFIAKVTAPFERLFGFTLLGHSVQRELQFGHLGQGVGGGF